MQITLLNSRHNVKILTYRLLFYGYFFYKVLWSQKQSVFYHPYISPHPATNLWRRPCHQLAHLLWSHSYNAKYQSNLIVAAPICQTERQSNDGEFQTEGALTTKAFADNARLWSAAGFGFRPVAQKNLSPNHSLVFNCQLHFFTFLWPCRPIGARAQPTQNSCFCSWFLFLSIFTFYDCYCY